MPAPTQCLGIAIVLSLGACAELQSGAPAGDKAAAGGGTCPADSHQDWVGKRVDYLNDIELPEGSRVIFPTTPVTMDFREERLNVEIDKSDTIARVFCG